MILLPVLFGVLFCSCGVDIPDVEKAVWPEEKEETATPDDASPAPSGTFDYTKLDGCVHPRLYYSADDFVRMRELVKTNPVMGQIHNIILKECDRVLNYGDLEYSMAAGSILGVSRNALTRIGYLAYGYRMTGKYVYLLKAEKYIQNVCSFKDWNNINFLDTGEMAFAVAIGLDWLYDDLSNETKNLAFAKLQDYALRYIDDSKLNTHFLTQHTNWNQVCCGGLVAAALTTYDKDKSNAVHVIETCLASNKAEGMQLYSKDGNWPEGYSYWGYGTTYQVLLIAALEKIFGNDGGLYESNPGFAKSPTWVLFMSGTNGKSFNFADCKEIDQPKLPMWWFANRLGDANLLINEKRMLENGTYAEGFSEYRMLPQYLSMINPDQCIAESAVPTQQMYYGGVDDVDSTPVVLIHTDWTYSETDKYLGIKGGRACTNHNHMDGGTFVYDAYGLRWAMDMGLQDYTELEEAGLEIWDRDNQLSQRWTVYRLNNFSHNVITINNNIFHVKAGTFLDGKWFEENPGVLGGHFTSYAPNRYGNDYDVDYIDRTVKLVERDGDMDLVITDKMTSLPTKAPSIRWAMATPATATIVSKSCIKLEQEGRTMYLMVSEPNRHKFTMCTWEAKADVENKYDAPNPGVTMVGFTSALGSADTAEFTVTLSSVFVANESDEYDQAGYLDENKW